MRKIYFQLTAILLLAGLHSACGSGKTQLALKLSKGESYSYEVKLDQHSDMGGNKLDNYIQMAYRIDVDEINKDQNYVLGYTLERVLIQNAQFSFDSNKADTADQNGKMFAAMRGSHFTAEVSTAGKVIRVAGYDEMADRMLAAAGITGQELTAMKKSLSQMVNNDNFKATVEQTFDIYPEKIVNPGESWTKTAPRAFGMALDMKTRYTLLKSKDTDRIRIETESTLAPDSSDAAEMLKGMHVQGSQKGSVELLRSSGFPVQATSQVEIKGADINMTYTITREGKRLNK